MREKPWKSGVGWNNTKIKPQNAYLPKAADSEEGKKSVRLDIVIFILRNNKYTYIDLEKITV